MLMFAVPMAASALNTVRLLSKKDAKIHHRILAIAFLDLALAMGMMLHYFAGFKGADVTYDILTLALSLTIAPTLNLFVKSITCRDGIRVSDFLFFIPAVIVVAANIAMIPILGQTGSREYAYLYSEGLRDFSLYPASLRVKFFLDSTLFRAVNICQAMAVFAFSIPEMSRYQTILESNFSNKGTLFFSEEKGIKWFSFLMLVALVLMCSTPFPVYSHEPMVMACIGLCLTGSIVALGYYGHTISGSAYEITQQEDDAVRSCDLQSALDMAPADATWLKHRDRIITGLRDFIDSKGYLNPDITVADLAAILNSNRVYVSEAVKQLYGESFCSFINRHRVEHAKQVIKDNMNTSMKSLALDAGYNSFTNFYRNFVRYAGVSPSEWRNMMRDKKPKK